MVVPNRHDRQPVPNATNHQVKDEEQEVAVILHADAIVDPGAVMVNHEDAPSTNSAVVSPCWLKLVALIAHSVPDWLQAVQRFGAVTQRFLYLSGQASEPIIIF